MALLQQVAADLQAILTTNTDVDDPDVTLLELEKDRINAELETIHQRRLRGAFIRSRAPVIHEYERPTATFCRLESTRARAGTINSLTDHHGQQHRTPRQKLQIARSFYENLYLAKPSDPSAASTLLGATPARLTQAQQNILPDEISLADLQGMINRLPTFKAPGPDGLTGTFYKTFSGEIVHILHAVYKQALKFPGSWAPRFTEAHICLLYKKGDRTEIENYRPIALLNYDYKILTGIINNRLAAVAPFLLHSNQSGFVQDRQITDCIHTVDLAIHATQHSNNPAVLLLLDQKKAYDRVSHQWLLNCMLHFGIPRRLAHLIHSLNATAVARITMDGYLSHRFAQKSGVRQGCPLSPLLYNLTLEPLNCWLRAQRLSGIKGIQLGSVWLTNIHFADDTALFACFADLPQFASRLRTYGAASGSKLNRSKGALIGLGRWKKGIPREALACFPQLFRNMPIVHPSSTTRYLGVQVGSSPPCHTPAEWATVASQINRTYARWSLRPLGLKGRTVVIKSLATSQLWYRAACQYLAPTRADKMFGIPARKFLWNDRTWHFRTAHLQAARALGGMALPDLPARLQTVRVGQLFRLLHREDDNAQALRSIMASRLPDRVPSLGALLLLPNTQQFKKAVATLPPFWQQAVKEACQGLFTIPPDPQDWPPDWPPAKKLSTFLATPIWGQTTRGTTDDPNPPAGLGHFRLRHQLHPTRTSAAVSSSLMLPGARYEGLGPVMANIATYTSRHSIPWADPAFPADEAVRRIKDPSHRDPTIDISPALQWIPPASPHQWGPHRPQPLETIRPRWLYSLLSNALHDLIPPGKEWQPVHTNTAATSPWTHSLALLRKLPVLPATKDLRRKLMSGRLVTQDTRAQWALTRQERHPSEGPPDPKDIHPGCPHCATKVETLRHLFWTCPAQAKVVWDTLRGLLAHWAASSPDQSTPLREAEALLGLPDTPGPFEASLRHLRHTPTSRLPDAAKAFAQQQLLCVTALTQIWQMRWNPDFSAAKYIPRRRISEGILDAWCQATKLALTLPRQDPPTLGLLKPDTIVGSTHPLLDRTQLPTLQILPIHLRGPALAPFVRH
jgi:hypothetical protein